MDKITKAQKYADQLLDEVTIRQVGYDKGPLKDEPESIKKSEEDLEDYVKMEKIADMLNNIQTYLGEDKEIKISDVPKDKQKIFKINRGKAREKGGALTKAEKGGKPIKEADQVATAQQKDTLFDKLERVVKDSDKLKPTITKEPTTESDTLSKLQAWGKKFMNKKRKRGLKVTEKRDKALKAAAKA